MHERIDDLKAPFFASGNRVVGMMAWTLMALSILIGLFSIRYDHGFMAKYLIVLGMGLGLEACYCLWVEGRFGLRSGSSMITSALLISSIPTNMPLLPIFYALVAGVVVAKLSVSDRGLHLNPVLVGRLFLMMAYHEEILNWTRVGLDVDAVSTATPVDLFHQEEIIYGIQDLFAGRILGNFEEMLEIVPGGPGEIFTPVILLIGLFLWWKGILDVRLGISFVFSFAVSCYVFKQPVLFNVLSGAVIFSAVFIGGDPRTTPSTKGGRIVAGILAGVGNAAIRSFTNNSEGIVYTFLVINILSPTLDRVHFLVRGAYLRHRQKLWRRKLRKNAVADKRPTN